MAETRTVDKVVEMDKKIKATVNKRYSKTQPVEKFILDDGWMDQYYSYIGSFFVALGNVLFIVPAIVMGILEGLSQGMLRGLQRATSAYEKRLGK